MIDWDEDDSKTLYPTFLDIERLLSLDVGEIVDGEVGTWRVSRNKKDEFIVILKDNCLIFEFEDVNRLILFLKRRN